jgi:hypothetical protein
MCPGLRSQTLCATHRVDDHLGQVFCFGWLSVQWLVDRVVNSRRQRKAKGLGNRQGSNVNVVYADQLY